MGGTAGEDLEGKTVVFGITGGIAAYKAPLLVRGLKKIGLDVHAVLTEAAHRCYSHGSPDADRTPCPHGDVFPVRRIRPTT